MKLLSKILTTARFEFTRSFTLQRMTTSFVLAMFPPAMLFIILMGETEDFARFVTCGLVLFVGLLSLLLWASPNVHGELEGRSWSYVCSRSSGRYAILFGKYLNAVLWSIIVCWTAVTACVIETEMFAPTGDLVGNWMSFTILVFIASPFYASIFSLIGVVFSRKSMVFGASYIVLSEMILAWIPANINKFTGGYHLFAISQELFPEWFLPLDKEDWNAIYGNVSATHSIYWLIGISVSALIIAAVVIRWREYIAAEESL